MSKVRILSPRPRNSKPSHLRRFFTSCLERVDSNGKLKIYQVRTFPSHDTICRLRGIPDNLPAFDTWQIYSLSPRPRNSKPSHLRRFFTSCLERVDSNGKLKIYQVRTFPSHDTICRLRGIRDDFVARCLQNLLIVSPTRYK